MKAFGVRLAAGAVIILLGAIMAAQAQKDQQDKIDSAWEPTLKNRPSEVTPIVGEADGGEVDLQKDGNERDAAETPNPFPDMPNPVQLVQHVEEIPNDGTFALPTGDPPAATEQSSEPLSVPDSMAAALKTMKDAVTGGKDQAASAITAPLGLPKPLAKESPSSAPNLPAESHAANPMPALAMDQLGPPNEPIEPISAPAPLPLASAPQPSNALRGGPAMEVHETAPSSPNQMMGSLDVRAEASGQPASVPRSHVAPAAGPMMGGSRRGNGNQFVDNTSPHNQLLQTGGNGLPVLPNPNQNQNPNQHMSAPMQNHAAPALHGNPVANLQQPIAANMDAVKPKFNHTAPNFSSGGQQPIARMASHSTKAGGNEYAPGSKLQYAHPGDRRLEGVQQPSVVIQKTAPREVKVGKPASFAIRVQNTGSAEAIDVKVHDRVPVGMRLTDASPRPTVIGKDGQMVWQLGAMGAGQERTITMQLVPEKEGELGSVARVTFEAAASVRTMSTRPELKIVQLAPKEVLIGQQMQIELEVSNPGTGNATGVILQEDVPEGLEHPKGRQLDNLIGTLRPGEVRRQMLTMRAVAPGTIQNTIRLKADDGLETNHTIAVNVVAPKLQVALSGPKLRFLEREAKFDLDVANVGTAIARNVEIAAYLDRGFRYVSTENEGRYVESEHAVFWAVENLPVGARGQIPLVLLPVQEGARTISMEAKADLGVVAKSEKQVSVNSLAELTFSINDSADPIEVGGETTYELRLRNSGSRPDSNVQVQIQFPPGVEVLSTDGNVASAQRGVISFQPRANLAANGELVYQIQARGLQPGTHKIQAIVKSDQSRVAVTKEESTMVYADR